jgi:magnesium transporter
MIGTGRKEHVAVAHSGMPDHLSQPADAADGTDVKEEHTAGGITLLRLPRIRKNRPGTAAGIDHEQLGRLESTGGAVRVTVIDYRADNVLVRTVDDIHAFVAAHRPDWSSVCWINVDGLTDMKVVRTLAEKYELHPLAVEDLLHVPQRPKVETFGEGPSGLPGTHPARLFVVARMLQLKDEHLSREQISFFVGHRTLLTFQESPGDVWDPIRRRLQQPGSQLRRGDASFLLYALIDAIVDHCFPILEFFGERLEELEEQVLLGAAEEVLPEIHRLRRELLLFRREAWPMRDVIRTLQREPHECMGEITRTYLRDVHDHIVQIIDLCDTYREFAAGLAETYMSSLSVRMNEVIKVLTIITTIFIPITFLAGVYGMNFRHMPEEEWVWAYPAFWVVCLSLAGGMMIYFKRKGWL